LLCDLLDPRGTHGQGGAFLQAFLAMIDHHLQRSTSRAPWPPADGWWSLVSEFPATHGRLDILLTNRGPSGPATIIIENKWDHRLGDRQLERYAEYLVALSPLERGHRKCLVYLNENDHLARARELREALDQFETRMPERIEGRILSKLATEARAPKGWSRFQRFSTPKDAGFHGLGWERYRSDSGELTDWVGFGERTQPSASLRQASSSSSISQYCNKGSRRADGTVARTVSRVSFSNLQMCTEWPSWTKSTGTRISKSSPLRVWWCLGKHDYLLVPRDAPGSPCRWIGWWKPGTEHLSAEETRLFGQVRANLDDRWDGLLDQSLFDREPRHDGGWLTIMVYRRLT
jgi:hypothetical protein